MVLCRYMKREIKFRCWFVGRMAYNIPKLQATKGLVDIVHINWDKDDLSDNPADTWTGLDDYVLMQYTGLKDKNGKEIYEGDVVRFHQFLFNGTEIEKEGTCVIKSGEYVWLASHIIHDDISEYMGYTKQDQLDGKAECYFIDLYGLHEDSFEIIGNIYKNPDLLNDQSTNSASA